MYLRDIVRQIRRRRSKHSFVFFVFFSVISAFVYGCNEGEKTTSLEKFTSIGSISISPNGKQILFTGCGYKGYEDCTIYRYDIYGSKLYRYLTKNNETAIDCGRFFPDTNRFVFSLIKQDHDKKRLYDDMQLAVAYLNGDGFRVLTKGSGVKVRPAISYDEGSLVFAKGRMRNVGKTMASNFDLYLVDVKTGTEIQLTKLEYYGVSRPYFTSDSKYIVYAGDNPMRLPYTSDVKEVESFIKSYKSKYNGNIINACSANGASVNDLPVPFFDFDGGTEMPSMAKDGKIFFIGIIAPQRYIYYYLRNTDGKIEELDRKLIRTNEQDVFMHENDISPDGKYIAVLLVKSSTNQRHIRVIDLSTMKPTDITIVGQATNIILQ